jgi:hypothetical protein
VTLLYQDHLIVASSEHTETTGKWSIWVGVYWSSDGARQSKILPSITNTFDTKDEAERSGFEIGNEWIDNGKPADVIVQSSGIR